ncbi:hypothetical protein ACZ90_24620 [Streptomyces albus subsp. albus]|nr:hypothetical protein ACZ90_24620 [Streptomyces albus subsp. albus]
MLSSSTVSHPSPPNSGEDGRPVDVRAIEAVTARALMEYPAPPPYEELCKLHADLLRHIEVVRPLAAAQIDGLWHGSVEWYQKASKLDTVKYQVALGLGSGMQSAVGQVRSLGYTLRFLVENAGLDGAGDGARS